MEEMTVEVAAAGEGREVRACSWRVLVVELDCDVAHCCFEDDVVSHDE